METLQPMLKDFLATKPAKQIEMKPSGKRPGAKRMKLYFGPHTLPKKGEVQQADLLSKDSAN